MADLTSIQKKIFEFRNARYWARFLDPKTLAEAHRRLFLIAFAGALCLGSGYEKVSSPGGTGKGWTKAEAESKVGKRVRYERLSQPPLLQWGPIRKNERPVFQKPLGRGVKPGATGTVTSIVKDVSRGYEVIIEWDPEEDEVWESGLYQDNYGRVVELPESPGATEK